MRFLKSEPKPGPSWCAGPGVTETLTETAPEAVRGRLVLEQDGQSYLTLGDKPPSYARLPEGFGIAVEHSDIYELVIEASSDDGVRFSVLVLEFGDDGERVGTQRFLTNGVHHYQAGPGVEKILVALRTVGAGVLDIDKLSWRQELDIFQFGVRKDAHRLRKDSAESKVLLLEPDKFTDPYTIAPFGSVKFCCFSLAPGRYEIELVHGDPVLADHPQALRAYLAPSAPFDEAHDLEFLEMERRGGVAEMPVRSISRGRGMYRNRAVFTLLEPQDWIVVEIGLSVDRFVNIDRSRLRPATVAAAMVPEGTRFAAAISDLVTRIGDAEAVHRVVYADISLNVVDGSSIWLSSLLSIVTSRGRCILVTKSDIESDIVMSNVSHRENLNIVQPADVGLDRPFEVGEGMDVVRRLDERLPNLSSVFVRGSAVIDELFSDRRFAGRGLAYLTDFYEYTDEGIVFPSEKSKTVGNAARLSKALLMQNRQVETAIREMSATDFESCDFPPSIPNIDVGKTDLPKTSKLRVGYAGKITPLWGIVELLDWCERLQADGSAIELTIVCNKISEGNGEFRVKGFRRDVLARLARLGATLFDDFNREQAMAMMNAMDFVWCWRPAKLEESTLELSTKLVEMAAMGARCICYPNEINRDVLGDDYPFFVREPDDFDRIIATEASPPSDLAENLRKKFSLETVGENLFECCVDVQRSDVARTRLLVSGHGLKFIEPYISDRKAAGYSIEIDPWEWGKPIDLHHARNAASRADVILCEWGLANAVWHSRNKPARARLLVRCHAQEVREKAQHFGTQIDAAQVEKFIFVSDRIRRRAIELFGWPEEKTVVVPNFLLDEEFRLLPRRSDGRIRLGMVGIVPESKRFDRALDLLAELGRRGLDAELRLKGHRPEDHDYMFAPGRIGELKYYAREYARLKRDPSLRNRVHFDGWGNDVADWYGQVDYVLSPSDHESFHYALADGVIAGSHPLVWSWEDAAQVYPGEWIVDGTEAAADRIEALEALDADRTEEVRLSNRKVLVDRYGHSRIFARLDELLGLS